MPAIHCQKASQPLSETVEPSFAPWHLRPYSLITWWDMEQFSAERFVNIGRLAGALTIYLKTREEQPLSDEMRKWIDEQLRNIHHECNAIGLWFSLKALDRAIGQFASTMTCGDAYRHVCEFQNRLIDELEGSLFLHIPQGLIKWYLTPRGGWEKVIQRFPGTLTDVEESSRCLACERYAGAVFHVMLVAEIGAIEIGKLIEINDPKPGWPATIREMRRIVQREKYQDLSLVERKHRPLLMQLLPLMESMQEGWRNKVSHVENKLVLMTGEFSPQVAEEIIVATRGFMRGLATDLP